MECKIFPQATKKSAQNSKEPMMNNTVGNFNTISGFIIASGFWKTNYFWSNKVIRVILPHFSKTKLTKKC